MSTAQLSINAHQNDDRYQQQHRRLGKTSQSCGDGRKDEVASAFGFQVSREGNQRQQAQAGHHPILVEQALMGDQVWIEGNQTHAQRGGQIADQPAQGRPEQQKGKCIKQHDAQPGRGDQLNRIDLVVPQIVPEVEIRHPLVREIIQLGVP